MNAQNSTNSSIIDLNALSTFVNARIEEQVKIKQAVEVAKAADKETENHNRALSSVVAEQVSLLQKNLAAQLKNREKARKDAYHAKMVEFGMDSDKFPLEDATKWVDQNAITPVLESVGKAAKVGLNLFNGVKTRIAQGFKS